MEEVQTKSLEMNCYLFNKMEKIQNKILSFKTRGDKFPLPGL